jgi:hypothetical protein
MQSSSPEGVSSTEHMFGHREAKDWELEGGVCVGSLN